MFVAISMADTAFPALQPQIICNSKADLAVDCSHPSDASIKPHILIMGQGCTTCRCIIWCQRAANAAKQSLDTLINSVQSSCMPRWSSCLLKTRSRARLGSFGQVLEALTEERERCKVNCMA